MKTMSVMVLVLVAMIAVAQEHPSVTAQANQVYVGADGKYETNPDTAVIQFNIAAQEDTSKAAYDHASKNAEQIREILRNNGVDPKAAQIGYLALQPIYDWKNPKHKVIAYKVSANVTLKLKDFSKVGPITQQLAEANVSETQTLNYILENMDEAKNHAVEDAYRRARNSADTIAHASGRTLGDLSYASVDTFENVRPIMARAMRPMAMAAAAPAPTEEFAPQTVMVTAHVNALFNLK